MGNFKGYKSKPTGLKLSPERVYMPESKDQYKIVFIGESRTGAKTSLINRLEGKEFSSDLERTISCSFTEIQIPLGNNRKITFHLWDTMGQEIYRSLIKLYLRDSDCLVIGYDINNKKNFEEAKNYWYPLVKEREECNLIYLIGNKIDLNERREVEREEAIEFAKSKNLRFFEISCKTGEGIKEFFDDLVHNLLK